jgi:hypothetical protein
VVVLVVFDPAKTDAGILTITLKAITNTHSSERVLQLELMAESVSNGDDDGDGISNNNTVSSLALVSVTSTLLHS